MTRFLAAVALVPALSGCGREGAQTSGAAVATVNGRPVPADDFAQALRENAGRFRDENEARTRVLETVVDRELLYQEAQNLGIDRRAALGRQIETQIALAHRRIRQEILINALLREKVGNDADRFRPTDQEVAAFYQLHAGLPFADARNAAWRGPAAQANLAARTLLYDERTRKVRPLAAAFVNVAQHLAMQKQEGALSGYLRTLRDKAKVEVDRNVVVAVNPFGAAPAGAPAIPGAPAPAAAGGAGARPPGAPPGAGAPAGRQAPPPGSVPAPKRRGA